MGLLIHLRWCLEMFSVQCCLEIVDDLTAEEFLLALRRFIARRGNPSKII